jgi:hypothetical protein
LSPAAGALALKCGTPSSSSDCSHGADTIVTRKNSTIDAKIRVRIPLNLNLLFYLKARDWGLPRGFCVVLRLA